MHFSWLHLTDLHCGMEEHGWLWQNVRESLFEDLEHLRAGSGPWDLILFTGDLAYKGTKAQFDQVDALLAELGAWIAQRQGGRGPVLLAVPGNHDIQRPASKAEGLKYLKGWAANPELQETFWTDKNSVVRKTVNSAFQEYSAWWGRQPACQGKAAGILDFQPGLLPGDFSATVEGLNGCCLGILGLNTAFLQLAEGDYERKLALHSRQFQAACGADGPAWAKRHNACLLMTHQPPDWLDGPSRGHLDGEIAKNGRFALHLCGHMHEPRRLQIAEDGNKPRVLFQARSLFGLEHYGEKQELDRSHGYAAGRITLGPAAGAITLWPRSGERSGAEIRLDRDPHQGLPKGREDTEPYRFALSRPCTAIDGSDPARGPGLPPADPVFNRTLAKVIDQTLVAQAATPLRDALWAKLPGANASSGEKLCGLEEEGAVATLIGAVTTCLKQAPRGEASRDLRGSARRLLGWLLMRFVREEWCAQGPGAPSDRSVSVRIEVGSEAGAEVLWARWGGDDAPPEFRVIGRRVVGSRNLLGGVALPEEGWEDWTRYLDDAKAALWVVLFGEPSPKAFGKPENERLRKAFAFDSNANGGARFYLTVRDQDVAEPLAQPEVLDALRQDLGLPVLFVAKGPEDRFISIGETRLQDLIKQCLKILKEHGDD